MKVYNSVLTEIDNDIRGHPSEMGGILGSYDGEIISEYLIDKPSLDTQSCCCYSPNVEYLNSAIQEWMENNICFMGIFHTHFSNARNLSYADKQYIHKIMHAMPGTVDRLYFPVYVLPVGNMECYLAERSGYDVIIRSEPIEILQVERKEHE